MDKRQLIKQVIDEMITTHSNINNAYKALPDYERDDNINDMILLNRGKLIVLNKVYAMLDDDDYLNMMYQAWIVANER